MNIHTWLFQENIQTYTGEITHKVFRQIHVFLKNFLKIRKYGFVKKTCVLFCQFKIRWNDRTCIYKLCQLLFSSWDEECVPGRINENLRIKIRNVANSYRSLSTYGARCFFKINIIEVPMKKRDLKQTVWLCL